MRKMETGVDLWIARNGPKIILLNHGFTVGCSVTAQKIAEPNGNLGVFTTGIWFARTARWGGNSIVRLDPDLIS
jgi:hypothetical protein